MVIKNISAKIINVGSEVLMPDMAITVSNAIASAPSIQALAELGFIRVEEGDAVNVSTKTTRKRAAAAKGLLIDAIALIESGQKGAAVIAVTAPYEVMLSRIMARDGLSEAEARRRLDAQKEEDFFVSHADYVIVNNGDAGTLEQQVDVIARQLGLCQ